MIRENKACPKRRSSGLVKLLQLDHSGDMILTEKTVVLKILTDMLLDTSLVCSLARLERQSHMLDRRLKEILLLARYSPKEHFYLHCPSLFSFLRSLSNFIHTELPAELPKRTKLVDLHLAFALSTLRT